MRPLLRSFWLHLTLAWAIGCCLAPAAADAQVGIAIPNLEIHTGPASVNIRFPAFWDVMNNAGGVTLFAAGVASGPPLVRLPFPGPFGPPTDDTTTYGWDFAGIPPGHYSVVVVLGIVAAPNQPPSAWTQFVVSGGCNSAPGVAAVDRDVAGNVPDTVRLFLTSYGGCASSYRIEVGTTPGASNVLTLEQPGVVLSASQVPPGHYYVRATGRNQFGPGPRSPIYPVAVPPCYDSDEFLPDVQSFAATVVGHNVTLHWTPAPGRPSATYYEIGLAHLSPGVGVAEPRILLPASATSYSASVPSGTYQLRLYSGNACGTVGFGTIPVVVP